MNKKLEEFLEYAGNKAIAHRKVAKKLVYGDSDDLNDVKWHDGMADMANVLTIKFKEIFSEELSK